MPYPEENQSMHAVGTMFVLHYDKLFFVTKKLALLFCECDGKLLFRNLY